MMITTQVQTDTSHVAPIVMGRKDYLSVLLRLIGMDLYKVRRRLMLKALLIIGAAVIVGVLFLVGIAGWYTASKPLTSFVPLNCAVHQVDGCINHPVTLADMQNMKQSALNGYAQRLNVPGVWNLAGLIVMEVFSILGIILAGTLVGGEYSLGTVRLMFTRGPTRLQFLIAKIVVLAIYVIPMVLFFMLLAALMGAVMSPLIGSGASWSFFTAAWLGHFVLYILIGMLFWFAYILMALFFGTLGRSTVAGIVGPLVWLSIEPLLNRLIALLAEGGNGGLSDFVKAVPDYFLGNNLSSLLQDQAHALSYSAPAPYSAGHSLLVVAVYLVLFLTLAFWFTVRRDVTH